MNAPRRCIALPATLLLLAACGGSDTPVAPMTLSVGAPSLAAGPGPERTPVALPAAPVALAPFGAMVAVATAQGVYGVDASGTPTLLQVAASAGEPTTTGPVTALARRGAGILVAAQNGLFHDFQRALLVSPLSSSLPPGAVTALDAFGSGAAEEVWLASADAFLHVSFNRVERVEDPTLAGPPEAVVALDSGKVLASRGGQLVELDLGRKTSALVVGGIGRLNAAAREGNGTLYLATDQGLLVRAPSGSYTLRTLSDSGAAAVHGVAVSPTGTLAVTDTALVQLGAGSAQVLADLSAPLQSQALAVDGDGTAFVASAAGLERIRVPVGFGDVRPLLSNHCMSCHAGGAQGAPKIALDDYQVAKAIGANLVRRVRADGVPAMPPETVETLAPGDVSLIVRWKEGGYLP